MKFFVLNNQEMDLIEKFKSMSVDEQINVTNYVFAILKLTLAGFPGTRPCRHKIAQLIEESGHPEITRACYMAQIFGIPWMAREP